MKSKTTLLSVLLLLVGSLAFAQAPGYDFTRTRIFSGFDGKMCKTGPTFATDWDGTVIMTYTYLLLTGSDVFFDRYITKSEDNGQTWSKPKKCKTLRDTYEGDLRVAFNASPRYSMVHKKWYAIGGNTKYAGDKVPFQTVVDGKPYSDPYYAMIDAKKTEIGKLKKLPVPFRYGGVTAYGDPCELDNGDILQTFYYITPEQTTKNYKVIVVRYRFNGDDLEVVEAGSTVECRELNRGVYEPSLVRFQGKFYLTLRSDERGMYCESEDGLHFGPLKTWCWEDGTAIGNKNTQQHWINLGDSLYLTYTRENGANNHVFRNRAPVYSARFDPQKGALIRETEFPLVPELGARLGNFETVNSFDGRAFLVTAEWMQPVGCQKYGSDNSLWFISISKN